MVKVLLTGEVESKFIKGNGQMVKGMEVVCGRDSMEINMISILVNGKMEKYKDLVS